MINIFIFSLFMCISNTYASEDPKNADWFTGKAAQRYYRILQTNLERDDITIENSVMLCVCRELVEWDYVWFSTIFVQEDIFVKIDINAILYTLSQEISRKADTLVPIFREEDVKVGRDEAMICHALGRCVPKFQPNDIDKILFGFPQVQQQCDIVSSLKIRYEGAGSDRFSIALKHLLWQKDRIPRLHADICETPPMDCHFVRYFEYQYRMNCAFMQQYAHQYSQPMNSALKSHDASMKSVVMDPVDPHLLAYVCRGVKPTLAFNAPNYMSYAETAIKVRIVEELPKIIDRLYCTVVHIPEDASKACLHNVYARLDQIKRYIQYTCMRRIHLAALFAWAFAMERKGDEAFYALGFFRNPRKKIHYLWISCKKDIPQWLYALVECTDIQNYGDHMRSNLAYHSHELARSTRDPKIPVEDENSYSDRWKDIMSEHQYYWKIRTMGALFNLMFPDGDAPGAR
ncbi:MAG: hypothetical protein OXC30_00925 [Alphaproteobacteria bacterium]|nr:hypothetical protein [Alphaproteobacteria bacterium]